MTFFMPFCHAISFVRSYFAKSSLLCQAIVVEIQTIFEIQQGDYQNIQKSETFFQDYATNKKR